MGRAAIAEEARGVAVGAGAEVLDVADAGASKPRRDEAGKIEHRVTILFRRDEEATVVGIGRDETREKFRADLIARLPDHGTERNPHARAFGAELLHRIDRRLDDTG